MNKSQELGDAKSQQKELSRQELQMRAAKSAAIDVGLRYVSDGPIWIHRVRAGQGFQYIDGRGKRVRNKHTLDRIRSLAIPPAWTDTWICPWNNGHLQAVGRDARGRKQYRYHNRFREVRDTNKYAHMIQFACKLPRIRKAIARHLRQKGLAREKVLAAIVRIMEQTLIRVGNKEYAHSNESYGLTTMHNKHAAIHGNKVVFAFRGKSGVEHEINFEDQRLAGIVRACQELPQQELFAYLDEKGQQRDVISNDVNEYLRMVSGADFTAKDFRTWAGTVLAMRALRAVGPFNSNAAAKRNVKSAIEKVAGKLGNTSEVCRKCYIHPEVINSYINGALTDGSALTDGRGRKNTKGLARRGLSADEVAVLELLKNKHK